jgi:hypothetical protein
MDPLQQLLAMDATTLATTVHALLHHDPAARQQLHSLAAALNALADTPQPQGGASGAVFGNASLFGQILRYAIDVDGPSSPRAGAIWLVKLGEVCREWGQLNRTLPSIWLSVLKRHAPIGAADGGALAMAWPGGPSRYLSDYMCIQGGKEMPKRFSPSDLVLGMEIFDQNSRSLIFAATGALDMWETGIASDSKIVIGMRAEKDTSPNTPALLKLPGSGGFGVRVLLAWKEMRRMVVLLDTRSVGFQGVEDRTPEGETMHIFTSTDTGCLTTLEMNEDIVPTDIQFRLVATAEKTADGKSQYKGLPGGGRLLVEKKKGRKFDFVSCLLWSHVL